MSGLQGWQQRILGSWCEGPVPERTMVLWLSFPHKFLPNLSVMHLRWWSMWRVAEWDFSHSMRWGAVPTIGGPPQPVGIVLPVNNSPVPLMTGPASCRSGVTGKTAEPPGMLVLCSVCLVTKLVIWLMGLFWIWSWFSLLGVSVPLPENWSSSLEIQFPDNDFLLLVINPERKRVT